MLRRSQKLLTYAFYRAGIEIIVDDQLGENYQPSPVQNWPV